MSKRNAQRTRSGPITYIALAVVLYALLSVAYALATTNSACGELNDYKEWRLVPPGWECPAPGPIY
ncbi:hypothetical protein [Actinomarinicola tropica]|uniref:Uncharacterized protein n=1 Tax=Actinomarinicola tropica TaxID=2789776 RepID=A0A5Q2RI50_9ACTN|nr:hypothetical protein [Actinomarinicola tropica]QGG95483.1 hypothetical protein GH723_10450 [Actinomarinicola tropica]